GAVIAFDKIGQGPAVILVDGALCYRSFGPMPKLAPLLAPHFTVYVYDRRGRGDSGDPKPYAVEREIEDIEALIKEAGGSAFVLGSSPRRPLAPRGGAPGPKKKKAGALGPAFQGRQGGPSPAGGSRGAAQQSDRG